MKFSESWLREMINVPVTLDQLTEQLTMAGLEVEDVESCQPVFTDVTVARVATARPHPDAEKLTICELDVGSGNMRTVVCGATNVAAGHCYAYAGPGATLPGDFTISKRKIRGVSSEGMLCSEKELGLADNSDGIFQLDESAAPGTLLADYLGLNDSIIELSLTPNRGDCLSVAGIAREVAVLNNQEFSRSAPSMPETAIADKRAIDLQLAEACPRYCGRIIRDINADVPTPIWISERLRRSGIRSINVVVDLTNYVMLEMGQPMHAFDNDTLSGDISIRLARPGEKLVLLDGQEQDLLDNTLLICDDTGPVAMAGVMGGAGTAVSASTSSVFLESAFFSPQSIMGRARQYGLHTDASHRFERGVDPALAPVAMERLSGLLLEICGGKAGPVIEASAEQYLPDSRSVSLRATRISQLLGIDIPAQRVEAIFSQLGFVVTPVSGGWEVGIPSFRFDIAIEADLIEELARIHGYSEIEGCLPAFTMKMGRVEDTLTRDHILLQGLVTLGYREVITYSFVDPALQALLVGEGDGIALLNPISSDMAVMRKSLWPGLVQTLQYNLKRQQTRVRLFESGHIFDGLSGPGERRLLAGICCGKLYSEQWDMVDRLSDFYDIKADICNLMQQSLDITELTFEADDNQALHPGQAASILYKDQQIGTLGRLHPQLQRQLDIQYPVILFELELDEIPAKKALSFTKFSKYPSIRRDLSIIIAEDIPVQAVLKCVQDAESIFLHNLELFDVYQGEGIDLGKKSLALGLTFQRSSSTLTDEEADTAIRGILNALYTQFGAILRE